MHRAMKALMSSNTQMIIGCKTIVGASGTRHRGLHAADHHDSARHDPAGLKCLELTRAQRSMHLCPAAPRDTTA